MKIKWRETDSVSIVNASVIYVLCGWYAFDWKAFLFYNIFVLRFNPLPELECNEG